MYPDGKFSPNLDKLKVGDSVLAKGPKGRFDYKRNMKRHIGAKPIFTTLLTAAAIGICVCCLLHADSVVKHA